MKMCTAFKNDNIEIFPRRKSAISKTREYSTYPPLNQGEYPEIFTLKVGIMSIIVFEFYNSTSQMWISQKVEDNVEEIDQ